MSTELQFDQVPQPAGAACSSCQSALQGSYYQANGHVLCEPCTSNIRNALTGQAGGFGRFAKGTLFGIGFGLAGGAVYTAVMALAHIQAGIITILIGWLVGKGVSRGSGGRGGVGYQILAVLITYVIIGLAIGFSVILMTDVAEGSVTKAVFILISSAVAAPVLEAFSGILGALITFFGLWQAWSSNKAAPLEITGPHALAPTPVAASEEPPPYPTSGTPPQPQGV